MLRADGPMLQADGPMLQIAAAGKRVHATAVNLPLISWRPIFLRPLFKVFRNSIDFSDLRRRIYWAGG